jgi:methyl-accepting chemotaxis protein
VVAGVITTMTDITNASKRVFDIISVIDGIAFQTNILALNAAVEAARAGEQGRGFAVVAAEVRSLAQRSAQAAKEVKTLIEANVNSVGHGSRQVAEAGDTMNQIISRVRSVSALIEGITTASSEQSKGIDQVGSAVAQLDQVTQQNAALVEESAAAAESLKHQANHLSSTMAVFRLT